MFELALKINILNIAIGFVAMKDRSTRTLLDDTLETLII